MLLLTASAALPPRVLGQAIAQHDPEACGAEAARMQALLNRWPAPADTEVAGRSLVVAFGSSVTEAAFVPAAFDQDPPSLSPTPSPAPAPAPAPAPKPGTTTRAYNFGQLALSADLQVLFAARAARRASERAIGQTDVVLLELTPRTFSRTFSEVLRDKAQDYYWPRRALLSQAPELWPTVRAHPAEALRGAFYHHLFADVPPRAVRTWLGAKLDELTASPPCLDLMNLNFLVPSIQGEITAFCAERAKVFPPGTRVPVYDPETRGFIPGYARLRPAYERLLVAINAAPGRESALAPEAWEMDFDPAAVADVITTVQHLKQLARRVVLVRYPENITDLPSSGPVHDAQPAWAAICQRIAQETGAPVVDLSRAEGFSRRDFYDYYHLVPTAAERASALLAARLPR
jgi:hypothetical protein